ncbi:MAG: hypothetical protein ACSLEW_09085 [Nocardioides sp.]
MGYSVQLIKGEVQIAASNAEAAVAAIRALDRQDDLKTGWSTERGKHWAFTNPDNVRNARTLSEYLTAFRFLPIVAPDGDLLGVELDGGTRKAGDEHHLWTVLAPYVEPGGEMIWAGEDEVLTRWSFDGHGLTVSKGRMIFD